jgi:TPR repeat protein
MSKMNWERVKKERVIGRASQMSYFDKSNSSVSNSTTAGKSLPLLQSSVDLDIKSEIIKLCDSAGTNFGNTFLNQVISYERALGPHRTVRLLTLAWILGESATSVKAEAKLTELSRLEIASSWAKCIATQSTGEAHFELGMIFLEAKETAFAMRHLDCALSYGHADAGIMLGLIHESRDEIFPAKDAFVSAANLGSIRGMREVGEWYVRDGRCEKAIKWFQKASDLGDLYATERLGELG